MGMHCYTCRKAELLWSFGFVKQMCPKWIGIWLLRVEGKSTAGIGSNPRSKARLVCRYNLDGQAAVCLFPCYEWIRDWHHSIGKAKVLHAYQSSVLPQYIPNPVWCFP